MENEKIDYANVKSCCENLHRLAKNMKDKLQEVDDLIATVTGGSMWSGMACDNYTSKFDNVSSKFDSFYKETENCVLWLIDASDAYEIADKQIIDQACLNCGYSDPKDYSKGSSIFTYNDLPINLADGSTIYVNQQAYDELMEYKKYLSNSGENYGSLCSKMTLQQLAKLGVLKNWNDCGWPSGKNTVEFLLRDESKLQKDVEHFKFDYNKNETVKSQYQAAVEGKNDYYVVVSYRYGSGTLGEEHGHTFMAHYKDGNYYYNDNWGSGFNDPVGYLNGASTYIKSKEDFENARFKDIPNGKGPDGVWEFKLDDMIIIEGGY